MSARLGPLLSGVLYPLVLALLIGPGLARANDKALAPSSVHATAYAGGLGQAPGQAQVTVAKGTGPTGRGGLIKTKVVAGRGDRYCRHRRYHKAGKITDRQGRRYDMVHSQDCNRSWEREIANIQIINDMDVGTAADAMLAVHGAHGSFILEDGFRPDCVGAVVHRCDVVMTKKGCFWDRWGKPLRHTPGTRFAYFSGRKVVPGTPPHVELIEDTLELDLNSVAFTHTHVNTVAFVRLKGCAQVNPLPLPPTAKPPEQWRTAAFVVQRSQSDRGHDPLVGDCDDTFTYAFMDHPFMAHQCDAGYGLSGAAIVEKTELPDFRAALEGGGPRPVFAMNIIGTTATHNTAHGLWGVVRETLLDFDERLGESPAGRAPDQNRRDNTEAMSKR
ncbi:MAG: hypothetical protein ACPGU7_06770 [Gammaproteobacteria bacterium]